ncbi:hypothetical protein Tco_1436403, partial [Tanacetum coccineum]
MKNQETPKVYRKNWNEIMERELGEGYSFIKKKCFICGSLSHLIRYCDFYEKKMERKVELKKQRVFNTGNGVAKPVWNNANMVNHANHFVPRPVQLSAVRPKSNSVRPNVNTVRQNVKSVRPNVNTVRQNVKSVRGHWGTAVKTSAGYNWRNTRPNSNCNSRSNFVRTVNAKDHPLKNMEDRGIFDSGCSAHMTGNKDHLDEDEDEDAKNSSKQGRNLQEEGLDEMVRSIIKEKLEEFETPTQGKTSGEADISPEGLEAAETLAK